MSRSKFKVILQIPHNVKTVGKPEEKKLALPR
jgi:hypothetical protein